MVPASACVVLLVWMGLPGLVYSQQHDCSKGCPGSSTTPVCGEDGLTYESDCLAACQGVAVTQQGRCGEPAALQTLLPTLAQASFMEGGSRRGSSSSSAGSEDAGQQQEQQQQQQQQQQQVISMQEMQQFVREGYRLLGHSDTGTFDPGRPHLKQQQQGTAPTAPGAAGSGSQRKLRQPPTAAVRHSRGLTYQLSSAAAPGKGAAAAAADTDAATATAAGKPQASGAVAGQLPLQIPFERAAYDPSTEPLVPAGAQGSGTRAAAAAALSSGASPAGGTAPAAPSTPVGGAGQGVSVNFPEHELLVQFMQQYGRRKLLQETWRQATSTARGLWHSLQHHLGPPQPPQTAPQQQQQQVPAQLQQQQLSGRQRALQYVLGRDDRREVKGSANTQWPYSAVGQFLYAKGSCSGVMVGPGAVLTAAHCVYSRQLNMWQQDMVFVPHRHRRGGRVVEPYGRIPVQHVTTYTGWTDNSNATDALNYDLAVVKLSDSSVGHKTGWLGMAWDKKPFKGRIVSAGYPGDKARGSLWVSTCSVTDFGGTDTRFLTSCDSWNGQSGSPMWEHRKSTDMYYLRAVMSYEACLCCTPDCSCCINPTNGGCKITQMHYKNILKWR